MRFTVAYDPEVEADLANIWMHASDRGAVSAASNKVDSALRIDPVHSGENRGAYRCLKVPPLLVLFEVSAEDCLVRVFHVQRYP